MKALKILSMTFLIAACGGQDSKIYPSYDFSTMHALDGREPILVIGDSISMDYTPYLVGLLPNNQVIHNTGNAQHSRKGRENIDSWAGHSDSWKICTFNHGLHDVRPYNNITLQDHEDNLRYMANVLLNSCDRVIFITTTWIPENVPTSKYPVGSRDLYSAVSEALMAELNIEVCDLYSVSLTIKSKYKDYDTRSNVHFKEEGSEILAKNIVKCINQNN